MLLMTIRKRWAHGSGGGLYGTRPPSAAHTFTGRIGLARPCHRACYLVLRASIHACYLLVYEVNISQSMVFVNTFFVQICAEKIDRKNELQVGLEQLHQLRVQLQKAAYPQGVPGAGRSRRGGQQAVIHPAGDAAAGVVMLVPVDLPYQPGHLIVGGGHVGHAVVVGGSRRSS